MNLFIAVRRWWRAALFALCAVAAPSVSAIELSPVLSGLSSPVLATHARDGSRRLFVVEQVGRIRVLQPGATTSTTFQAEANGLFTFPEGTVWTFNDAANRAAMSVNSSAFIK